MTVNNREVTFRIVGSSPVVAELHQSIVAYAPLPFPVLIQGEPGTGKELIARELHRLSGRSPMITVDCAGLSSELFASELFGHERGAFTGAVTDRVGLVEAAANGTVFLDEVGELDLVLQARLLRFLQEKEFRRVGSNRVRTAECRILAATNRDLVAAVRAGQFRSDLYERLRVIGITAPPLRERRSDLQSLIDFFSVKHSLSLKLTPTALARLHEYAWPGNVRELEHLVIRLGARFSGYQVDEHELRCLTGNDSYHNHVQPYGSSSRHDNNSAQAASSGFGGSLAEIEMKRILEVLDQTDGQMGKAAEILGIGRTTLYRRLRKLRDQDTAPGMFAATA